MEQNKEQSISIARSSLLGRCPRCGEGSLYAGFFTIVKKCSRCNLSLEASEQGDGAAFFCICIIGSLAGILAAVVEVAFQPPYWLHAAIWIPFIIISSLFGIRATKAAIIAMQYKFRPEDFS